MALDFRPLLERRFKNGESPVWDDRREVLFFVEMGAPHVHSVRLDGTELRSWPLPALGGSIGLGRSGRLIVAQPRDVLVLDPDTGALEHLAHFPEEPETNRLNDGKVGPDGAFWVGSMDLRADRQPVGSLYRIDGKGNVTRVLDGGIKVSNGLAWSADGRTMFHSDSRSAWIDRYDFDPASGAIGNRVRIARIAEADGRPDGGACDVDGDYWSAGVSAGRLNRWTRDGVLKEWHAAGTPAPSMPCFCGPDLKTLVLTSLSLPDHAELPTAGALMIAKAPVSGAPVGRWADA
jgi:sugar lactone lactonase YvrE